MGRRNTHWKRCALPIAPRVEPWHDPTRAEAARRPAAARRQPCRLRLAGVDPAGPQRGPGRCQRPGRTAGIPR
ncbi:hypothetical protein G6F46_015064 [Rhizopus delemar]|nr:hypothetical protein G6F46_015064 [Rhizopus delemar]